MKWLFLFHPKVWFRCVADLIEICRSLSKNSKKIILYKWKWSFCGEPGGESFSFIQVVANHLSSQGEECWCKWGNMKLSSILGSSRSAHQRFRCLNTYPGFNGDSRSAPPFYFCKERHPRRNFCSVSQLPIIINIFNGKLLIPLLLILLGTKLYFFFLLCALSPVY